MHSRSNPTRFVLCSLAILLLATACYPITTPIPSQATMATATAAPVSVATATSPAPTAAGAASAGDRLVFASDRSGSTELYVVDVPPAGSAQAVPPPARQLTQNRKSSLNPAVSPDGQWIAYMLGDQNSSATPPPFDLWLVSLDGRRQFNLTQNPAASNVWLTWSPDGKQIAFAARAGEGKQRSVWVQDVAPILASQAPAPRKVAANADAPVWSPDGRQIAYLSLKDNGAYDQLCLVKPDGTGQRQLTAHSTMSDSSNLSIPAWSPDSRWMLVPMYFGAARLQLVLLPVDGTTAPIADKDLRIVTPNEQIADSPAWEADSRWVVFRGGDRFTGIDVMDMQSGEVRQIVEPSASQPTWSRDGSRIAYSDDHMDIIVTNRDGSNPINVTNNPANDYGTAAWVPPNRPK